MSKSKKIIELFTQGEYSKKIRNRFNEWLVSPYRQEEKDESLQEFWDSLNVDNEETLEKSFAQTQKRIAKYEKLSKGKKIYFAPWMKAAVIIMIPLLSFFISFLYVSQHDTVETEVIPFSRCFVPNGETRKIILPDLSEVNLNAGSLLIYPQHFTGNQREVYLIGEARFSVTRNEKQPFIVNTSDFKVKVLGTVFNVCSYSNENLSTVTVKQGAVSVLVDSFSEAPFIIKPNEQVVYDRLTCQVEEKPFAADDALAWQKGGILFNGQTIHEIAKMIERKYGIGVYITTNKYDNAIITAKFVHGETLDQFLSVLKQLIPGMKYEIDNQNVYIR